MRRALLLLGLLLLLPGCDLGGGNETTTVTVTTGAGDTTAAGTTTAPTATEPPAAPGEALLAFAAAARESDAETLFSLLTPAAQERFGPLEAFRNGTATELSEGLGSYPASAELVLAEQVGDEWAVAAIASQRTVEGTEEFGAYAAALRLVDGEWRVALGGPITIEPLEPAPQSSTQAVQRIAVSFSAPQPLEETEVWLDGEPFAVEVGGRSQQEQTAFGQPRAPLEPGQHVVVAFAATADDASARAWTFRVE